MTVDNIQKIILIGAGKLATNFGISLKNSGYNIVQVYNRTSLSGLHLADTLSSAYIDDLQFLSGEADLYCICVSDSSLESVARKIHSNKKLVIHFSGTISIDVLKQCSGNYGVIYPPQTFTKQNIVEFDDIPLCVEANSVENQRKLSDFAYTLSKKVFPVTFLQRKVIHLSSVFAGNFSNFLFSISESLLKEQSLPMELVLPLIERTASNARATAIFSRQTGPAIREDQEVIKTHLALLSNSNEYREIYRLLTESIIMEKHKHDEL